MEPPLIKAPQVYIPLHNRHIRMAENLHEDQPVPPGHDEHAGEGVPEGEGRKPSTLYPRRLTIGP